MPQSGARIFPVCTIQYQHNAGIYQLNPDAIEPVGNVQFCICSASGNTLQSGFQWNYRSVVLGFPFETIVDDQERWR
jgi:hypothetical protein